ncbi:MAG: hypothetical protein V2J24_19570, partial [Pseudomonadales bacterium]|nr:hypothetical protein [Pseudomonadales bacterium]
GGLIDTDTGRVMSTADDDALGLDDQGRMTAFQLALWEIVQETIMPTDASDSGYDVTSGAFRVTSVLGVDIDDQIYEQANQWLADLGTTLQARDDLAFWVLDTAAAGLRNQAVGGQSQIALSVVPLPAGIVLFGSALLLLLGFGRRSRGA